MTLRVGDLDVAEPDRLQIREELRLQLVAVDQHQHRRVLEHRRLDQLLGCGDHGEGLARPLGVPHQSSLLPRLGGSLHDLVHGTHLMGPQHHLLQLVVGSGEEDEVGENPQHPLGMHERLAQVLVVAGGLVPPVERRLRRERPRRPVVEVDQLAEGVHLHQGQQLRALTVVAADLVECVGHPRLLGGRLRLNHDHRNPVDEEHHVGTDGLGAIGERELGRDVEGVPLRMLDIEQRHVAFPVLGRNENGLQTTEILPGVEVSFDRGLHLHEAL